MNQLPRVITEGERILWDMQVSSKLEAAVQALLADFEGFEIADIPPSTEITLLTDAQQAAIRETAGIVLAQVRNLAAGVIPAKMCGCPMCQKRIEIVHGVYQENMITLRMLQAMMIDPPAIVAVPESTQRHTFDPMPGAGR